MGDAIVAAVGGGIYHSVQDAVAHMVRMGTEYPPQAGAAPLYDALYRVYVSLYPALRGLFSELAEVPYD